MILDNQYDSILEAIKASAAMGFKYRFIIEGKHLRCIETNETFTSGQLIIEAFNRVEGASDPDDSAVIYLIKASSGSKGTLIDSYGMYANAEITAFMKGIPIDRIETAGNYENKPCLNCGTILKGHYCYTCGQKDEHLHEPFYTMVGHAVAHYWHFDGKFLTTLWPLVFKPGFLSTEFISGRRIRYVHPIQLYLFLSIIFFILFSSVGASQLNVNLENVYNIQIDSLQVVNDSLQEKLFAVDSAAAKRLDSLAEFVYPDIRISTAKDNNTKPSDDTTNKDDRDTIAPVDLTILNLPRSIEEYEDSIRQLPADKQPGTIRQGFEKMIIKMKTLDKKEGRERISEYIIHNLPKLMFVLIPIFALILKLLFIRHKIYFVDHAVFTLHFHSFAFLLMLLLLIGYLTTGFSLPRGYLLMIPAVYLYFAIKRFYQLSYFKTLRKLISLSFLYFFSVIITGVFYLLYTLMTV